MNKSLKVLFIWVFYIFFLFIMYAYFSADVFYFSSQRNNVINTDRGDIYTRRAIELNPLETKYYVSRAFYILGKESFSERDETELLTLLEVAKRKNPKDLVLYSDLIPVYAEIARVFNYEEKAREYYLFLKTEYPKDLGLMTKIAYYEKELEMKEDHGNTMEIIKNLRPDVMDWYYLLR